MIADLDTLLIALYVELTDQIIPSLGLARSPAGISRSGCASRSTARQTAAIQTAPNRHPARHPPMAPRHPCQPKTVCVPFMRTRWAWCSSRKRAGSQNPARVGIRIRARMPILTPTVARVPRHPW